MHQELLARINSSQLLLPENDHVNHETHQNIAELNFFYGIGEFSCFDSCWFNSNLFNSSQLLLPENDHLNHETHQNIAELNFFYGIGEFWSMLI